MGTQGRVLATVDDDRGALSAWMMMKRGCRALVVGNHDIDLLRIYDPTLRVIDPSSTETQKEILGVVKGTSLKDLDSVDVTKHSVPVYFPTIGMDDKEVDSLYDSIVESEF